MNQQLLKTLSVLWNEFFKSYLLAFLTVRSLSISFKACVFKVLGKMWLWCIYLALLIMRIFYSLELPN